MSENASVTITRQSGYQFLVDFGAAIPQLLADEPAPLGAGVMPKALPVLAAAGVGIVGVGWDDVAQAASAADPRSRKFRRLEIKAMSSLPSRTPVTWREAGRSQGACRRR